MSRARSRAPSTAPTPRCRRAGIASCSTRSRPSCAAPARACSRRRWTACSRSVAAAGDDVGAWQAVVSALRRLLLPALPNEHLRWVQAEDLWHEARILIGELAERAQAQHRLHNERLAQRADRERRDPARDPAGRRADRRGRAPAAAAGDPERLDGAVRRPPTGRRPADAPARLVLRVRRRAGAGQARGRRRTPAPAAGDRHAGGRAAARRCSRRWARRASIIVEPLFFHDGRSAACCWRWGRARAWSTNRWPSRCRARSRARAWSPAWWRKRRAARSPSASGWRRRWRSPPASRRRSCRATSASPAWRSPRRCSRPPRSAATTTTSSPSTMAAGSASATSPDTASAPAW